MKFLKVSEYYTTFVRHVEEQSPGLNQLSYDDQMARFFSFDFGWADYWKRHMETEPGVQVVEIVTNLGNAQRTWATENGVSYAADNWESDILDAQIAFYKPEVVFFESYLAPPAYYKRKFASIKYVISWDGLAIKDKQRYEGSDMIASCHEGTVAYYTANGVPSYHFIFGFETSVLDKLIRRNPKFNTSFVGSVNLYRNGHRNRLRILNSLRQGDHLECWISGSEPTALLSLQMLKHVVRGLAPDALRLNALLRQNRGQAFGLEMYQILADSRITFNSHIDAAGTYAANIRLFEATGVGTCLLTDWKPNLSDLFVLDREVVAYKSKEECVEKVKWLLNHEDERKAIAQAGQQRVQKDYTLRKRILDFIHHIKKGNSN